MDKMEIFGHLMFYLNQDLGSGDITSQITARKNCIAEIKANENCTLAGTEETKLLAEKIGLKVKIFARNGNQINKGKKIMQILGENRKILSIERVALNIIGRMSGVATLCRSAKKKMKKNKPILAVTRKTVPGFQIFDKRAAEIAGVWAHRKNLSEMILLKDNHLKFFDSLLLAAMQAKKISKNFEIEVQTKSQALLVAPADPSTIMLDNFKPKTAKETIKALKEFGFIGKIELSGGITLKNISKYSNLGADIISMGELTKKAKIIDFSLDIVKIMK